MGGGILNEIYFMCQAILIQCRSKVVMSPLSKVKMSPFRGKTRGVKNVNKGDYNNE